MSSALLTRADDVVAALHPIRRQLLDALDEPDSATGLAKRLRLPRQKVNYHLRALEERGLVQLAEERQRRGLVERVMVRCHDTVLVDPAVADLRGFGRLNDRDRRGLGAVMAAAVGVLRHATAVAKAAAGQRVASVALDADLTLPSPAAVRAFTDDLTALIAHHDRPGEPGAMRFRLTTTLLPHHPEQESDD